MKGTDCIASQTTHKAGKEQQSGAQRGRRNKSKNAGSNSASSVPVSGPLNTKEVCRLLGCHYQTLLYREKRGQIKPFLRIKGQKFYHRADVLLLMRDKPVNPKPHYTKRRGGGPGTGEILINNQPAVIVRVQPEQPVSLWTKIKNLFSVFAAK